jgi:hypothetical protein
MREPIEQKDKAKKENTSSSRHNPKKKQKQNNQQTSSPYGLSHQTSDKEPHD